MARPHDLIDFSSLSSRSPETVAVAIHHGREQNGQELRVSGYLPASDVLGQNTAFKGQEGT